VVSTTDEVRVSRPTTGHRDGGPESGGATDARRVRDRLRRRVVVVIAVVLALTAAADAMQNPTLVERRLAAALPPGAPHRLPVPYPLQPMPVHASVLPYLGAIAAAEQDREQQVVDEAAQTTLERAKQDAAAALSGRPAPWLGGVAPGYLLPSPGGFCLPAHGVLTSGFGVRWGAFHEGIDIANAIGTPIYAVAAGTVIDAGPAQGFGLWVRIRHDDGSISVYGHLYDFFVSVGERVPAGMQIARMGNRGDSTGPHLHFEIHPGGGAAVDPLPWLAARGIQVTD
jgi:murein DD-endopeptidase MepM/ murein hydrolase activator NlpD